MDATAENSSQLPAYAAVKWREFDANPRLWYNLCPGFSNRREDNVIHMANLSPFWYNFPGNIYSTYEFAVLVNTRHREIREVLTYKLLEITQHMQEGKKFCLKLDFGPSMKQWFSGAVDSDPDQDLCVTRRSSDSGDMQIVIHNYTTPVDCCMNPKCILVCFPFWLLFGGSCYCINRKRKCIDDSHDFRDLPVVLITGVNVRVTWHQWDHHP